MNDLLVPMPRFNGGDTLDESGALFQHPRVLGDVLGLSSLQKVVLRRPARAPDRARPLLAQMAKGPRLQSRLM